MKNTIDSQWLMYPASFILSLAYANPTLDFSNIHHFLTDYDEGQQGVLKLFL